MLSTFQQEVSLCLEDILNRSLEKIKKLEKLITKQIESFFSQFEEQFNENFRFEIQSYLQLSQSDLQTYLPKLKDQLHLKFEKIENLKQIISEFKISPNFMPVDPLTKVPHQNQAQHLITSVQITYEPLKYVSYQFQESSVSPQPNKKLKNIDRPQTSHHCPHCQQFFRTIFEYRAHLSKVHNLILRFQCPECEFFTNEYFRLSPHLLDKHSFGIWQITKWSNNKKEIKTYECKKTLQRFQSRQLLSYHVKDNMYYQRFE